MRANFFSLDVSMPEVPTTRSAPLTASAKPFEIRADRNTAIPCIARFRASAPIRHGLTSTRSVTSKFRIARATAPTFPSFFGSTSTTRRFGTRAFDIFGTPLFLGMRVALKIAYEGRSFYGHQRQPDRRTAEGECLSALRAARILVNPGDAFFRSASRTDRGVSAAGNVIAFNTTARPDAVLGSFNGEAQGVWAWAFCAVPDSFHPRRAEERWYRYRLRASLPVDLLRSAASLFIGAHDFRRFTSDPPTVPIAIRRIDVAHQDEGIVIDFRARSFRRGMIRRIVSALAAHARGKASLGEIEASLRGEPHDFGMAPPEGLTLMDVRYAFPFTTLLKPKVLDDWRTVRTELALRSSFLNDLLQAASAEEIMRIDDSAAGRGTRSG
jgi:tRNA pseudouridine38-40 synthase